MNRGCQVWGTGETVHYVRYAAAMPSDSSRYRRPAIPSYGRQAGPGRGCALPPRLLMALLLVVFAVVGHFMSTRVEVNPVTGEEQRVTMSEQQEIALGLQAAPEMIQQYGGLAPDPRLRRLVEEVGNKLVQANARGAWAEQFQKYQFKFHLLADPETINAFALPGGQIFFTYGLLKYLQSEDEIAGVIGHEIGHVVARHSNEQLGKSRLWAGIAQAIGLAGADFNLNPQQIAGLVYQVKTTSYGRAHENQADELGVKFMVNAGYKPEALLRVMQVLKEKAGGGGGPEFLKTHPDPGNRMEHIRQVIEQVRREGTGIDRPVPAAR